MLVKRKAEKTSVSKIWKEIVIDCNKDMMIIAFTNKVKNIWDKKIAEFNYKVLHNILPCPANLKRWQKSNNDQCDVCNEVCDVNHLLITCKLARYSWQLLSKTFNIDRTVKELVLGVNQSDNSNFVISVISFILYKYWIVSHSKAVICNLASYKAFFTKELETRIILYKYMKRTELVHKLYRILDKDTYNHND